MAVRSLSYRTTKCEARVERIAEACGLPVRTCERALAELRDAGKLARKDGAIVLTANPSANLAGSSANLAVPVRQLGGSEVAPPATPYKEVLRLRDTDDDRPGTSSSSISLPSEEKTPDAGIIGPEWDSVLRAVGAPWGDPRSLVAMIRLEKPDASPELILEAFRATREKEKREKVGSPRGYILRTIGKLIAEGWRPPVPAAPVIAPDLPSRAEALDESKVKAAVAARLQQVPDLGLRGESGILVARADLTGQQLGLSREEQSRRRDWIYDCLAAEEARRSGKARPAATSTAEASRGMAALESFRGRFGQPFGIDFTSKPWDDDDAEIPY